MYVKALEELEDGDFLMAVYRRGPHKGAFLCSDCCIESAGFIRLCSLIYLSKKRKRKKDSGSLIFMMEREILVNWCCMFKWKRIQKAMQAFTAWWLLSCVIFSLFQLRCNAICQGLDAPLKGLA